MKQIVIILMGVLLIVSMVGGVLSTLNFKIKYGATATCGNTVGICSETDNPNRPLTIKEIRENLDKVDTADKDQIDNLFKELHDLEFASLSPGDIVNQDGLVSGSTKVDSSALGEGISLDTAKGVSLSNGDSKTTVSANTEGELDRPLHKDPKSAPSPPTKNALKMLENQRRLGGNPSPPGVNGVPSTEGLGALDSRIIQGFQYLSQFASMIFEPLKKILIPEPKPDEPQPSPPISTPQFVDIKEGTVEFDGNAVAVNDGEGKGSVSVPNKEGSASLKMSGNNLENMGYRNTVTELYANNNPVAQAEFPDDIETTVSNKASGEDGFTSPSINSVKSIGIIMPLIDKIVSKISATFVSAQPTSEGQYLKLLENNRVEVNGRDQIFRPKVNNHDLKVGGQNIEVDVGGLILKFNGQKTFASRRISNIKFGFDKSISNKLYPAEEYIIMPFQEENIEGYLHEKKGALSITSLTKEVVYNGNPLEIANRRLEMFS